MTYEELWLEERPKLEVYLRRRLPREVVEDVIDEAFTRIQGVTAESGALLWQTAFRVEQEMYRGVVRARYILEQAGLLNGIAISNIDSAIIRADFDRAFRRLPRTQQEAFALIELRGLTERETADVLGVPQQTVNWRCEAARTYLRGELS